MQHQEGQLSTTNDARPPVRILRDPAYRGPSWSYAVNLRRRYVIVLVLVAVFYLLLDHCLLSVMWRTPNGNLISRAMRNQQYLVSHPEARRMLILGDSRVRWALDPMALLPAVGLPPDSGLNVGLPNALVGDDLAQIAWLRRQGMLDDLHLVVWGMGLDRLDRERFAPESIFAFYDPGARGRYTLRGLTDRLMRYATPTLLAREALANMTAESTAGRIWAEARSYDPQQDYAGLGFLRNNRPHQPFDINAAYYGTRTVDPAMAQQCGAAVMELRRYGVRVIVLDMPIAPALAGFYEAQRPGQWRAYQDALEQMRRAGAEVYSDAYEFPASAFSDPIHLTAAAAERLTRDLSGYLAPASPHTQVLR